ncbi:DsbA family oxidoreductase [Paenibacillus radicis (ex Xue et al. 2023)]|uniref:DsbA family oxidoreductase n=1 Tax=Paenibacillus radicis (ex Xue et al. 2023) TaxID=2972489 RepID=A0ABT1YNK5_9BACL|nr:DsbA family oxidoreductase [Paenibacillus radicis (ex Xue et al. 2023)]MCR8634764.1 DsbA family oxidoreductase [Paenibacillus radicis (ex Xue et al. 2023)]
MKIEIWSDIMCPFCYIGKRKFEAALEQFSNKSNVEVVYRSFELDPNSKRDEDHDAHQMLSSKYGMSREQAISMNGDVARQASAVGLTFNFDSMILTNTFDAHRLIHYAAQHGKMHEMTERLLHAYFTESKHVGDHEVLADLAAEIGLDRNEASKALAGQDFAKEVRADEQEAATLGIRGVPYFVINRKYAISGAQSSEVFLGALQKAWDEDQPLIVLNDPGCGTADAACVDGVCTPKPEV